MKRSGRDSGLCSIRLPGRISLVAVAMVFLTSTANLISGPAMRLRHKGSMPPDLQEILSHMNETSKRLKTLSADLQYTKVTVVVDDRATQTGQIYYENGKPPQVLINFKTPEPKTILLKKNRAEIYLPKINEIDQYDLGQHRELVQQFLLLGFGSDPNELRKSYDMKLTGEEDIGGDTTVVLELTPRNPTVAAQLSKVQLWLSEESWLPIQQKFFEPDGDYLITNYSAVKVNRTLPPSAFEINAPGAKRVKPTGPST